MKQHILGFSVVRRLRQSPVFAFLLAVLLCGMLAGCVTGMHIPQGNETYVSELAQLLASNAVGKMPSVRTVAACLAGAYGWMLAAVILAAIPGRLLWKVRSHKHGPSVPCNSMLTASSWPTNRHAMS